MADAFTTAWPNNINVREVHCFVHSGLGCALTATAYRAAFPEEVQHTWQRRSCRTPVIRRPTANRDHGGVAIQGAAESGPGQVVR